MDNFWHWFGDLGTWVSGIATFLAVIVAVFYSRRQDRRETEQLVHNVYAWMQKASNGLWHIVVSNGTGAPIYDWAVTIKWKVDDEEVFDVYSQDDLGMLPPAQKSWPLPLQASEVLPDNDAKIKVSIEFLDRRNQRWLRSESNMLVRVQNRRSEP